MTIWFILLLLEICHGHLVYFVVIWYIFNRFGILYQEKSGNPADLFIKSTPGTQTETRADSTERLCIEQILERVS
jgi:hypothetical protein